MMKKYLLALALISFFHFQLEAQEVPEQQQVLISKVAATWCPPCGGWGWDLFEELIEDNDEKAVLLVAHHSGDLTNSVAQDFSTNFDAPYQPYFYVNTEDQGANSGNADDKRIEIKEKVDLAYETAPIANSGIAGYIEASGLEMVVDIKTKFFQEASGEYYLGVYKVESGIVNNQQGQGADAVHEKILTGAITQGSFGELLVEGNVAAGTEFMHNFIIPANTSWDLDHLELVTIIWEKVDDKYEVVNTNSFDEIAALVGADDLKLKGASMEVQPTVVKDHGNITIALEQTLETATLKLFDMTGRQIATLHNGALSNGTHSLQIDNTSEYSGMYFIVLESDSKLLTKKIIFK